MKREEAIKQLSAWAMRGDTVPVVAIHMAIKALDQEPCEDAISRQAYIERYRKWAYSEYGRKPNNEALSIRVAMSLPPVTPQPKTGHWEPSYADVPNNCSVCGENWDKYVYGPEMWYTEELPKFCPNCGVRIGGVENGDNRREKENRD